MKINLEEMTNLFASIVRANISLRNYNYHSESYNSYFQREDILSCWMIEYVYSGASGGSCWGTQATSFYHSSDEIADDISSDIEYILRENVAIFAEIVNNRRSSRSASDELSVLAKNIANHMTNSYIDGRSDWEYYGNGSEYRIGTFEFKNLFDKLKVQFGFTAEFSFEDLMAEVELNVQKDIEEYVAERLKLEVARYSDLISSIDTRKAAEKKNLEASIESHRTAIERAEKSILNIDKKYEKELKTLQAKLAELTGSK